MRNANIHLLAENLTTAFLANPHRKEYQLMSSISEVDLDTGVSTSGRAGDSVSLQLRMVEFSKVVGIEPKIATAIKQAGLAVTLKTPLKAWSLPSLTQVFEHHPIHLHSNSKGVLTCIGGFPLFALASAIADNVTDLRVLATIRTGRLATELRQRILEEEFFLIPGLVRLHTGDASKLYDAYLNLGADGGGVLLTAKTRDQFCRAVGIDRRAVVLAEGRDKRYRQRLTQSQRPEDESGS